VWLVIVWLDPCILWCVTFPYIYGLGSLPTYCGSCLDQQQQQKAKRFTQLSLPDPPSLSKGFQVLNQVLHTAAMQSGNYFCPASVFPKSFSKMLMVACKTSEKKLIISSNLNDCSSCGSHRLTRKWACKWNDCQT
jgi:hypothetical protein